MVGLSADFGGQEAAPTSQGSLSSDSWPQSGVCSQGLLGLREHLSPAQGLGAQAGVGVWREGSLGCNLGCPLR